MNETQKLQLEALIDYIVNTPNNFNANLFREYFMDPEAMEILVTNYMKKITPIQEVPSQDSSDVPILEPPTPSLPDYT